jgi:uncharacterized protein with ATP-grasp and redox domains
MQKKHLPEIESVVDLCLGKDPYWDAWVLHFMTENNLEHSVAPDENASPEQIRFMVDLQENQVFVPCSDWMFRNLLDTELTPELLDEYRQQWRTLARLVRDHVPDTYTRKKIIALSRHKFGQTLEGAFVIPSRLFKRLITIFLAFSAEEDPFRTRRQTRNRRAARFMKSPALSRFLNACPDTALTCSRIQDLRWELDLLELKRLFCLSTWEEIWMQDGFAPSEGDLQRQIDLPCPEFDAVFSRVLGPDRSKGIKILYLPESSGAVLFDLKIISALIRQGHRVTLAFKEGFFLDAPTFWDCEEDPVLGDALGAALRMPARQASKNELLKAQRENSLLLISDGSRERLNFYRTSVTFARAWKESDLIIAKGEPNYRRLIRNSHSFSRDVLTMHRDEQGGLRLHFKEKSSRAYKITESMILDKAESLIQEMRRSRLSGKQVMFYSAVVGSIPGQTKVAIEVLNTFVSFLRRKHEGLFVINPAEHFEPGMDGDDLMFMWEKVQRSGVIDIWRFQTVSDIEKSFELMDRKIPSVWNGKDATFSTGCTKEMNIALDMQKSHPELQIMGPSPEKFFRRREYGLGKFFDESIDRG